MKAEFPNANLQLWPGQFVNVRVLIETLQQVVTIPTPAVQRGPNGTFAYVVQADQRVACGPSRWGCRPRPRPSSPRASTPPSASSPRALPASRTAPASRSCPTRSSPPPRGEPAKAGARRRRQVGSAREDAHRLRRGRAEALPQRRAQQGRDPRLPAGECGAAVGGLQGRGRRRARRAASRARPTCARPKEARRNERLLSLHQAADRHLAAGLCRDAGRRARLLVAAGLVAAAGRFPDHPGHDAAARRQPRDHRQPRDRAARAPARARSRRSRA